MIEVKITIIALSCAIILYTAWLAGSILTSRLLVDQPTMARDQ